VPFPSADDLVTVVERTTVAVEAEVRAVADGPTISSMIALTREVPAASHVVRHAVDLVLATHRDQESATDVVRRYVRFGASPRGAQSMILAGKAAALLDGRPSVSTDDLRDVAASVLRHRLVLGYEATADGVTADQLVSSVLEAVPAPAAGLRGAP
jgi:MoxR-like ATPase